MRARWLVLPFLALSCVVAGAAWLLASPQDAEASHPDIVDQAIAELLTYQTIYDGGWAGVWQVDVAQEIVTYDAFDYEESRVHWDGTKLWIHRKGEPAPEELPAAWAAKVREVWDEWRAGFANTQFVLESPTTFDEGVRDYPGQPWYRVHLPFGWTTDYLVYVSVNANGTAGVLSVYHAATHQPVSLGERRDGREWQTAYLHLGLRPRPSNTNVPLSPDTYSPYRPARQPSPGGWRPGDKPGPHGEYAGPTWHQEQQFVRFVRTDPNGGLIAGPQMSQRCETAPTVYKTPLNVSFAFPDDPEREALALQAATDCPNAGFHMSLKVFHHAAAGARTCAEGQWRVVNTLPDPDVVLWQHQITECRTGPDDARLEYPTDLPLPTGSDPTGLEVQFQGEVRVECAAVGGPENAAVNVVLAGFEQQHQPTLTWPGCYPGWPAP